MKSDLLSQLSFFEDMPLVVINRLAEVGKVVTVEPNTPIVHQHDEARCIFFLLSGAVQFHLQTGEVDDALVGVMKSPGALIGWSAFRFPYRYTTTVITEGACRLLRLPQPVLEELFHTHPSAGYELLKRINTTVANRLEQARDQLLTASRASAHTAIAHPQEEADDEAVLADEIKQEPLALLQHSSFFHPFETGFLQQLAQAVSTEKFARGATIFQERDTAHQLYLLVKGEVVLSVCTTLPLAEAQSKQDCEVPIRTIDKAGQLIGWSAMVPPYHYRATATTTQETQLLVIRKEALEKEAHKHPTLGIFLMQRLLWVIGNRLRATRVRLIAQRYDKITVAIRSLLKQSAAQLPVTSPLHKIPHYLANRLTLHDAFITLKTLEAHGDETEQNLAKVCLELLTEVREELRIYQQLQKIYESVANAPETMAPTQIRNNCCAAFIKLFESTPYLIRGQENLPDQPGHIFIMNHLFNHPENTLPNDFQLTLDSHFVSSMILYKKYGTAPVRVIRKSRPDEYGHQRYYDKLGYIYVYSEQVDESAYDDQPMGAERRKYFLDEARDLLLQGENLVICPEGISGATEESPQPFKAGAFRLAAYVRPEPMIVPIAVANFDKKITRTTTTALVYPPFYLSDYLPEPVEDQVLYDFINSYHKKYQQYVKEAIALTTNVR
jgi:CRP-like cAMP-binding protein/1-acyl-sn-glycerol-3-phosphate acyltransferase